MTMIGWIFKPHAFPHTKLTPFTTEKIIKWKKPMDEILIMRNKYLDIHMHSKVTDLDPPLQLCVSPLDDMLVVARRGH